MARFSSGIPAWQDRVRHVTESEWSCALIKNYCRGQRDNKRALCAAADNMIRHISDTRRAHEQFFTGQTDMDSFLFFHWTGIMGTDRERETGDDMQQMARRQPGTQWIMTQRLGKTSLM